MIVKTLLDTDLYKFTTSYAYIKLFPYAMGTFSFNDRNETKYTEAFLETLKAEIKNLSQLRFTEEELEYIADFSRESTGSGCLLFVSTRIRLIFIWMKPVISTSK